MMVAGVYTVSEDPSMFVTGRLDTIGKDLFVFSFVEPAAVRIGGAFFDLFSSAGSAVLRIVILLFLQGFLSVRFPI